MKKILLLTLLTLLFTACNSKKSAFINTIESQNDHVTSVKKLENLIKVKGLMHFSTIDHRVNADAVQMNLKPETVVVFGNPKMGTVLMNCNPSMGLDLPLRILISTNYEGLTTISYTNPEYWSLKHNIIDKNCLAILNKAKIALANLAEETGKK